MFLLAFDTSTDLCTVAVGKKGVLLGERNVYAPQGHMQKLLPITDSLLSEVGCNIKDIGAIAVGLGPGSFTGVRIGVSIAKGLVQGLKRQVVGISSLDALAKSVSFHDGLVCAVIDAKRKEVYFCLYKCLQGKIERLTDYEALPPEELCDKLNDINLNKKVVLVGDALKLYAPLFQERIKGAELALSDFWYPRAANVGDLAFDRLERGECNNFLNLAPIYVRVPIAEEMWEKTTDLGARRWRAKESVEGDKT
ncbi:MAG TPA: tRNA (adenosine(37)-N6)-threonylcarbamoyltransferase complex dimerization subunit type 1 TsaB [Actinobacteria bacterium]|nr:tRNA (adenosine(37)-N6)-threonylcarbamoyltransferase complex dimerization subunit type 1 TsaB [Actinomycetota bacterium]